MGKVYDTTNRPNPYHLISQTPRNYVPQNYWLKEIQDKVDADWDYRPNRALIEQETAIGTNQFVPLEVVLQTVKTDKGVPISDDWRRVVFRDVHYQCPLGLKFKFSFQYDIDEPEENKSVWLTTNRNTGGATASAIIARCNGTLGSEYLDAQGITHYHYEPAVQTKELAGVNIVYNQTAVSQSSDLTVIVQHNEFTRKYYVNQRFIVGYDQVYRIQAISKFASNRTFVDDDLGTIILYFEVVQKSEYDNFQTRIAYNQKESVVVEETGTETDYQIRLDEPSVIPETLSNEPLIFKPVVYASGVSTDTPVVTTYQLMNASSPPQPVDDSVRDKYVKFEQLEGNGFSLQKLKFYPAGNLEVTCKAILEGVDVTYKFNISLRGL